MNKLHKFTTLMVLLLYLFGCGGGGGGGGGDDDVGFPTPTLPANATVITAMDATDVATSAIDFTGILSSIAAKTEAPTSIWDIIERAIDPIIKRDQDALPVASRETEDLSDLCTNAPAGTAILSYSESGDSLSGTITLTNCDFDVGLFVNGVLSVSATFNDATEDYSLQYGGTITITLAPDTITFVLNISETGNDAFPAPFSSNVSYSLAGIPTETYLVTTTQNLLGNYDVFPFPEITNGELIVEGANNTRLRIEVIPGNQVDVYFDDGLGGGFVYHSTISLI